MFQKYKGRQTIAGSGGRKYINCIALFRYANKYHGVFPLLSLLLMFGISIGPIHGGRIASEV